MLILACSRRKRSDERLLPAIERYDGPAFRVLRRFLREGSANAPSVLILSAEYGLIAHNLRIAAYDRVMSPARARELRPLVLAKLNRIFSTQAPQDILVFAGRSYLTALGTDGASPIAGYEVRVCRGTLGRKLSELHDWLHGGPPELRYNSNVLAGRGRRRIRGVEVSFTADQVRSIARQALREGCGNPERYESWCVPIDGCCVAPKWLVSRISGLPVGEFTTDEARRLLAQLGVEVRRA
jgi:Family of unknown function (DUF6884)